jgi:type I restriction enzyme S subunit
VLPGDVLVTLMGTVGRTAVAPSRLPTAISTKHLAVLTVDQTRVDPHWLAAALRLSPSVADQIGRSQRGVIMNGLNLGIIRRVTVACPPLPVQRQYAQAEAVLMGLGEDLATSQRDAEDVLDAVRARCFGRTTTTR